MFVVEVLIEEVRCPAGEGNCRRTQPFRHPDLDRFLLLSIQPQFDVAGDQLTEIKNPDAGLRLLHGDRLDHADLAFGLDGLGLEFGREGFGELGRGPSGIIEARLRPSLRFLRGIKTLTEEMMAAQQSSPAGFPSPVCGDARDLSILGANFQLGDQAGLAENAASHRPDDRLIIPAATENDADGVAPGLHEVGDIMNDIAAVVVVGRDAGIQNAVADALAVQPRLVVAEPGDVEPSLLDLAFDVEFTAEVGRAFQLGQLLIHPSGGVALGDLREREIFFPQLDALGLGRILQLSAPDPFRGPIIRFQQTHLPPSGLAEG